jgi:ABC-type phosphate/phosphonate transport system substrate-binding protein
MISNARMYAVTPAIEVCWRTLLDKVAQLAGISLVYESYPAPQPLETLWGRSDLGCVFMCGYPIALKIADVTPIAAPIPAADWAGGRPVYRSDLIVRANSPYHTLADTFGGRVGWTVEHSHSGFNALRHHLLGHRTDRRPKLYGQTVGHLITAQRILDEVLAGGIDVGPLDAYWHGLIARERPDLTREIRVLESTEVAPMPAFVASGAVPPSWIQALRDAFESARFQTWFAPLGEALMISGFRAVGHDDFATTLAWDAEARAANYPVPT